MTKMLKLWVNYTIYFSFTAISYDFIAPPQKKEPL